MEPKRQNRSLALRSSLNGVSWLHDGAARRWKVYLEIFNVHAVKEGLA